MKISDINFSRIPHRIIEKFLRSPKLKNLEDLQPLCYLPGKKSYSSHSKEFIIDAAIDSVWRTYIYLHPVDCWESHMISFGMMYSRSHDRIMYRNDNYHQLENGQLYFIRLRILGKLFQIPVTHEINKVDHEQKVIQTCYLQKGKSEGSQWIRLFPMHGDKTRVVHETIYKGDSIIREKLLYPYFHTRAISQFHENIRKHVKSFTEDVRLFPPAVNTSPHRSA